MASLSIDAANGLDCLRVGIGALQEARVASDRLVLRVAGKPLEGRIDVDDRVIEFGRVGDHDAFADRLERAIPKPQRRLCLALLGVGGEHEGDGAEEVDVGLAECAEAIRADDEDADPDRLLSDRKRHAGTLVVLQAGDQVEVAAREMHRDVGVDPARERRAVVERHGADVDGLGRPSAAGAKAQHAFVGGKLEDADEFDAERPRHQFDRDLVEVVARHALQRELAQHGGRLLLPRACREFRLGVLARGDVRRSAAEAEEVAVLIEVGAAVGRDPARRAVAVGDLILEISKRLARFVVGDVLLPLRRCHVSLGELPGGSSNQLLLRQAEDGARIADDRCDAEPARRSPTGGLTRPLRNSRKRALLLLSDSSAFLRVSISC